MVDDLSVLKRVDKLLLLILLLLGVTVTVWSINYKLRVSPSIGIDFDEPVYYRAGIGLAECLESLNLSCLATYNYNLEHPFLGKILYGLYAVASGYSSIDMHKGIYGVRLINIFLSSTTSLILTLISPFAGLLYAGDALSTKYGLEVYLDGFSALFVSLSYLPLTIGDNKATKRNIILSSIFAGLSIATKYTAIPALAPIPLYLLSKTFIQVKGKHRGLELLLVFRSKYIFYTVLWLFLAGLFFYVFNPSIWLDIGKPLSETRLYKSLMFHENYSLHTSMEKPMPFYQQFLWYTRHSVSKWHPGFFSVDTGVFLLFLGFLGLPLTLVRKPLIGYWIISYTFFLLIWPVKWPQYTLLLSAPLSISASILLTELISASIRYVSRLEFDLKHWLIVFTILSIISSTILVSVTTMQSLNRTSNLYIDTGMYRLVYDPHGLKPIKGYFWNNYVFIKPIKRGSVYNVPYDYLPTNSNPWPGPLYNADYKITRYIPGRLITGITIINFSNTKVLVEKSIEYFNSTCIHVRYRLINTGNKTILVSGEPSWAKDWGLGIELGLSPPNPYDYYQLVITGRGRITTRRHWYSIRIRDYVKAVGLIDSVRGYSFIV